MKSSFLSHIQNLTREKVEARKLTVPQCELTGRGRKFYFEGVFSGERRPQIIAEIKMVSPSQGALNLAIRPELLAPKYAQAGATAISVLTESDHFGGSLEDLISARKSVPGFPVLQKDFIVDSYQIYEASHLGADAVLLIMAMIGEDKAREFFELASSMGLSCMVEVHSLEEIKAAVSMGARLIGINNRDLHTLKISLDVSRELISHVPDGCIAISESGITSSAEIKELLDLGFDGFLIGSSFMKTASPDVALSELIQGVLRES